MEQSDPRMASFALQKRYENAVAHDKAMHKTACLGKCFSCSNSLGVVLLDLLRLEKILWWF